MQRIGAYVSTGRGLVSAAILNPLPPDRRTAPAQHSTRDVPSYRVEDALVSARVAAERRRLSR